MNFILGVEKFIKADRQLSSQAAKKATAFTLAEVKGVPSPRGRVRVGVIQKTAFTLAEVLITLGVIGVVAAMTLPVLIQHHRKQVVVTKLKHMYSTMNQAIRLSEAQNGEASIWALDCTTQACNSDIIMDWFNTYLKDYLKVTKVVPDNNNGIYAYLPNGSILQIEDNFYDMDLLLSEKTIQDRKNGTNYFQFRFNPVLLKGQVASQNKYTIKTTFEPFAWNWDGTREKLIETCGRTGSFCTKLIQYDGWQISNDYPKKL